MGLITKINVLGTTHNIAIPYGECITEAGKAAKTVGINDTILVDGAQVTVRFTNGNTAASPTLNVNGLGAKNIVCTTAGAGLTATNWAANAVITFTYVGTADSGNWVMNNVGAFNGVNPAFDGGALSGNNISGSQTKGSVTISESGTFFTDAAKTNFGVTTTKPASGTDGTNYLTIHEAHSTTSGTATGSTTITRGAVLYNGDTTGYINKADNTQALASGSKTVSASITVTPSVTDNFEPYYIPVVTPSFDGGTLSVANSTTDTGALSGGALTAGAGEVSITTTPVVTPSVSGTAVSSTAQTNFGVTTTKPSGTDGTNYITLDPSGSVTTIGKTKGRGSVTRAVINRAKFSSTVNRGAVLYNGAKHGVINIADNTQALASGSTAVSLAADSIASTSGTSNWSTESNITPTIAAGTNYYIPVVTPTASATAGTASATAGTTSVSGLTTGTYQTTATSGYTYKITATGGSASATGGSASVNVGKGVTAGKNTSATGTSTGTKTGTTSEIYLVKGAVTNNTSGGTSSGTINAGKQIKISKGYYAGDTYYQAASSPSLSGDAGAADVLAGKTFYSNDYTKRTGTMANNGTLNKSIGYGESYTIPNGFHKGDGVVTNSVGEGTIKSGSASIGTVSITSNTTDNTKFKVTASATIPGPTVTTAGYVSSTVGTKSTNTATVDANIPKIHIKGLAPVGATATPIISRQTKPDGQTWVDAANGNATTTLPTSGVYIKVKSAANTSSKTFTATVTSDGYGTADGGYTAESASVTCGALASADTYIPIKTGTATTPTTSITATLSTPTLNSTTNKYVINATGSKSITPTISAGYVTSGTAGNVTINGSTSLDAATWSSATLPSGSTATTLAKNTTYKISKGYLPADCYYKTQADPSLSGNAATSQVLSGQTFYSNTYTKQTGTMSNQGAKTATLNPGGSYSIPAGYHNGSGKITARSLNTQTKAPTSIVLGETITADSGKDGLSSVTIPSELTVSTIDNSILNISVFPEFFSTVNYSSPENEHAAKLNATLGGVSTAKITLNDESKLEIVRDSSNSTVTSSDLIASNIRQGANILGVTGTYAASSTASGIYQAQYANTISSGWSDYWSSYDGNMLSVQEVTYDLDKSIPAGASVRLIYNDFMPTSAGYFVVELVSATGDTQTIASPSGIVAANGPHTSDAITSNFTATKIRVRKGTAAQGESVYRYERLIVQAQVNIPTGYYGTVTSSSGSNLADISSYQYVAVKKAGLGNSYTPGTSSKSVYVKSEGWVRTNDAIATIAGDSNLIASNIKSGVKIFGVTGTHAGAKTEQTKTVALSMASGNQTVSADSGKVLTSVTITKPSTLIASNIKSGVSIGGITGTYTAASKTPNVKFMGLYNYIQRGNGGNTAQLENVTGTTFSGCNRRFGEYGAYVGCFGVFVYKGTPAQKPILIDANGVHFSDSLSVAIERLMDDPDASRNTNLYQYIQHITAYERSQGYTTIYLAPMAVTSTASDWGTSSAYYWNTMGDGDDGVTNVYIKNIGARCLSTSYND